MNKLLERRDGETDLQYHARLVYGKLVDKTLADIDYSELSECIYGQKLASDECRKRMYGSRQTLDVISNEKIAESADDAISNKITELRIERQKLFDERSALNKSIREVARQQELTEIIERAVNDGNLPKFDISKFDASDCKAVDMENGCRDLLVSLNDIHYGAVVDNHWRKYDSGICEQMMMEYAKKVIQIAKETGAVNCYVWNAGDCVSGAIHRSIQVSNKENVIQQVRGVSELIARFIYAISGAFCTVTYVSVAGNHSRIEANKKDSIVGDRLDNLVGWYVEARLQNHNDIIIANNSTIDDTMFMVDIRGKTYVGVHGDFDTSTSSVHAIKSMCNNDDVYCILSGHLHHNKIDSIAGVKTVMAGSFLGMDDYCVQRRIVGKPEQLVCVLDDSGIVCSYDIDLS